MSFKQTKTKKIQQESFKNFVLEQLQALDDVRCKSMFGGYGLYLEETFFAIIADSELYFKTNETTRLKYTEKGMGPFVFKGTQTLKNYYNIPVEILEDTDTLADWAYESVSISKGQKSA